MIYGSNMKGTMPLVEFIGHIEAVKVFIQHLHGTGISIVGSKYKNLDIVPLSVQILTIADNEVCNQF